VRLVYGVTSNWHCCRKLIVGLEFSVRVKVFSHRIQNGMVRCSTEQRLTVCCGAAWHIVAPSSNGTHWIQCVGFEVIGRSG